MWVLDFEASTRADLGLVRTSKTIPGEVRFLLGCPTNKNVLILVGGGASQWKNTLESWRQNHPKITWFEKEDWKSSKPWWFFRESFQAQGRSFSRGKFMRNCATNLKITQWKRKKSSSNNFPKFRIFFPKFLIFLLKDWQMRRSCRGNPVACVADAPPLGFAKKRLGSVPIEQ